MRDGTRHVLLDRAYGYAQAAGNFEIPHPLQASQYEDRACPLRQDVKGRNRDGEGFATDENSVGCYFGSAHMFRFKFNVIALAPDLAVSLTIREHACCNLETVASQVGDPVRTFSIEQANEDLLYEVANVILLSYAPPKIPGQRNAQVFKRFSGQALRYTWCGSAGHACGLDDFRSRKSPMAGLPVRHPVQSQIKVFTLRRARRRFCRVIWTLGWQ